MSTKRDEWSERLMRKLARLCSDAVLEPAGGTAPPHWHRLSFGQHRALAVFGNGNVDLLPAGANANEWQTFPLKKHSGGMGAARNIRAAIVNRERHVAEHKARVEADRHRNNERIRLYHEKVAETARKKATSQAAFDALAAEFDLIDRVRFVADEYGGASVYTDVRVDHAKARTFITTLVEAGVLMTFGRKSTAT